MNKGMIPGPVTNPRSRRFDALDGLRGLAALGVAIYHYSATWPGYLAVDFFFVLSGFIIYFNYFTAGFPRADRFIIHRLARLYPMHLFSLALLIGIMLLTSGALPHYKDGTVFTFIEQLTLLQNVGINSGGLTWNFPSWSVSVEFWMNLIFLFFLASRGKQGRYFLLGILGIVLIVSKSRDLNVTNQDYFGFLSAGLVRGLAGFLLGVVAYRLYGILQRARLSPVAVTGLQLLVVLGAVALILARNKPTSTADFFAPFDFLLVVALFALEQGGLAWLASCLSYLGKISYSIYLNQIAILTVAHVAAKAIDIQGPMVLATYIGALLAFSALTYHLVEVPARRGIRGLFDQFQGRFRVGQQT